MSAKKPSPAYAKKIAEIIKATGMTQEALAKKIGTSHVSVGRWIKGTHGPTGENLVDLCKMTGKDINFFYGNSQTDQLRLVLDRLTAAKMTSEVSVVEAMQRLSPERRDWFSGYVTNLIALETGSVYPTTPESYTQPDTKIPLSGEKIVVVGSHSRGRRRKKPDRG